MSELEKLVERAIAARHPERPQQPSSQLATPAPAQVVEMGDTQGGRIAAVYTAPERRFMSELRANGADDHELRVLHEVKHYFGVDLIADVDEYADGGKRARAVGSGSQWDDSRNTSNRSGARYGDTPAERRRQERDARRHAEQEREREVRERQGTLPIEQGEDGAT